ncbi:transglycosylase SLT domain-containing protein [Psychrobacter sp. FME13]|uniref:transglycosylase SLT domain-containing protein n=1 Tax=Psychrobacter sp. FME13 TaxID=2487708 RepID=UPI0017887E7B|nr:transglycosylase SLT domain-containing protein [Psychrobacter sp. FME13]MBE0441362.1 transglycosylase SLT domain-containing protein [Psychrobacter sp. FME13]
MASSSLGTLTLDLAVRLSEFTEGLSQAEREARDATNNINDSVTKNLGKAALAFGAMAATGIAAAGASLVAFTVESAKADAQLSIMANTANTSLKGFQVLSYGAAQLGVEQDALAGILGDVQEKLGEFSATGGGGAADFFEALQNNTKMTDEEIRNLGKTLQGKDGAEAIQLVKDKMDALGATSQEQRFVFESLAGDLGNLMPLFADGGDILNKYGEELEAAGVIKTEAAIEQSRRLTAQTQAVTTQFDGFKTQLAVQMMPVLNNLMGYFVDGKTKGGQFGTTMESIGLIAKTTAAGIVGVAGGIKLIVRLVQAFAEQVANIGITTSNFFDADGLVNKAKALRDGASRYIAINMDLGADIITEFKSVTTAIGSMYETSAKPLNGLAGALYETTEAGRVYSEGLATNTVEAEANAKAQEKRTAALAKAQKVAGEVKLTPNKLALQNAQNYGFANYEAQYGLPQGLMTGIHMQETQGHTTGPRATGPMTKYGKAKGGFQLIDATAERFKVDNAYNMEQATEGAAKYLSYLYKHFNGDLAKTIAAYNTGEGNVDKNPMTLILSDRWARDKKTGIGQTKQYTQNVLAYMKSATTDTSKLVYDTVTKQAQDAQKLQEDTLKRQQSVQVKYATAREKLDRDYVADITEIESLYAEGSIERTDLLNRAKAEYDEKRTATAKSILESYMKDEERLTYDHNKKIERIKTEFVEGDPTRQMLIDLQKAAYQEDLDNFRWAAGAKARAQGLAANNLSNVINMSGGQAASAAEDLRAEQTMRPDLYQKWKLEKDYKTSQETVDQMYGSRKGEINALDLSTGDPVFDATQRNKLLQEAEQEHLNKMLLMEEEHSVKKKELDKQLGDARIAIQEMAFSSMTGAAAMFFGENSKMHKAAFAMEKAFAVQKALMNIEETYSNTFNAISAIPLVGPYLAMPMAIAASAMQVASAAGIQGMSAPSVSGIAHGGLDYVPKESTYLLDKGERVLSPNQNSDLTKFMNNSSSIGNAGSAVQVNIINNSSSRVESSDGGRTITITDVRNEVKRGFAELNNPNSHSSKMVDRNVRGGRRR